MPTTSASINVLMPWQYIGPWLEFETSNKDLLSVKVDRKRKIAATTLLRAVSGLLPCNGGAIRFGGREIAGLGPREIAQARLAHVVEGHRVFTQQSVNDNLLLAGYDLPRGERASRLDEALEFFPEIAAKRRVGPGNTVHVAGKYIA